MMPINIVALVVHMCNEMSTVTNANDDFLDISML
jgi:hypothetical protein